MWINACLLMWMILAENEIPPWYSGGQVPILEDLKVDGRLEEWGETSMAFFGEYASSSDPESSVSRVALWLGASADGMGVGLCGSLKTPSAEAGTLTLQIYPLKGAGDQQMREYSVPLSGAAVVMAKTGGPLSDAKSATSRNQDFVGTEILIPWKELYPLIPSEGERFGLSARVVFPQGSTESGPEYLTRFPSRTGEAHVAELFLSQSLAEVQGGVSWLSLLSGDEELPPGMVVVIFMAVSPKDIDLTSVHVEAFNTAGEMVKAWEKKVNVKKGYNELPLLLETDELQPASYTLKFSLPPEAGMESIGALDIAVKSPQDGAKDTSQ